MYKILSSKATLGGAEVLHGISLLFQSPWFSQVVKVFQSPALVNTPGTAGGKGNTSASDYKHMQKK